MKECFVSKTSKLLKPYVVVVVGINVPRWPNIIAFLHIYDTYINDDHYKQRKQWIDNERHWELERENYRDKESWKNILYLTRQSY